MNALHELDFRDDLYVPVHVSQPFSLRRVKVVMWKVLEYLNRAYPPSTAALAWVGDGKDQDLDYPSPQVRLLEPNWWTSRESTLIYMNAGYRVTVV